MKHMKKFNPNHCENTFSLYALGSKNKPWNFFDDDGELAVHEIGGEFREEIGKIKKKDLIYNNKLHKEELFL